MSITREVSVFECERCKSRREAPADRVPSCGVTHTDYDESRFPDGSWVQIQTRHYEHHGPMTDTGETLQVNPFQAQVDERIRLQEAT